MINFLLVITFGCLFLFNDGHPYTFSDDQEIYEVDLKTYVEESAVSEYDESFWVEDRMRRKPNEYICGNEIIQCTEKEEPTHYFHRLSPNAESRLADLDYKVNRTCQECHYISTNKPYSADNLVTEKVLLVKKKEMNCYEKGPVVKLYQGCDFCRKLGEPRFNSLFNY